MEESGWLDQETPYNIRQPAAQGETLVVVDHSIKKQDIADADAQETARQSLTYTKRTQHGIPGEDCNVDKNHATNSHEVLERRGEIYFQLNFFLDVKLSYHASLGAIALDQRSSYVNIKNNKTNHDKSEGQNATDTSNDFVTARPGIEHFSSLAADENAPWSRWCRKKATPNSIRSVCIHIDSDEKVYRWKPGSNITFNVKRDSFPNLAYADRATRWLEAGVQAWNDCAIGVKFEKVADDMLVVFSLVYSRICDTAPNLLADAFFPNDPQSFRRLCVYESAFKACPQWMDRIMCHELGHILGARHEFAPERESKYPCLVIDERNPSSTMGYEWDMTKPSIQSTDMIGMKQFYAATATKVDEYPIVDLDPREKEWEDVANN
ncbi:hypothetical protein F5Y04DRAFT_248149 [Hypomontagnella monticulosa]|nr:hypothetical protein F5Y04DRAFT_248149 [Hypomontagnella monticulosa]